MGQRGPIPLPFGRRTEQAKKARAKLRPNSAPELFAEDAPKWLSRRERRIWAELLETATADGLAWRRSDGTALATVCGLIAQLEELSKRVAKEGLAVISPPTPVHPEGKVRANPLLAIQSRIRRELLAWSKTLGLSLEAKRRLSIEPPRLDPAEDPWEKLAQS